MAAKGEVAATVQFTTSATANRRFQLIAQAYLYSAEEEREPGSPRTRSLFLLAPGFVSRVSDLPVKTILVYPNPTSGVFFPGLSIFQRQRSYGQPLYDRWQIGLP